MANFHIVGRTSHLGTVQKTFNWQVSIPKPNSVTGVDEWTDSLLLRARSASIPGTTITAMDSQFMGMKQFFAGNAELEHTLAIEFEEFEDQRMLKFLNAWTQSMFNTQDAQNGGGGNYKSKNDYCVDLELTLFASDTSKLEKKIIFHNCWLQSISASELAYGDAGGVKMSTTFQWDYFTIDNS